MKNKKIQENNPSKYYVIPIEELLSILNRKSAELDSLEVKWTKKNGYETCIVNFDYSCLK